MIIGTVLVAVFGSILLGGKIILYRLDSATANYLGDDFATDFFGIICLDSVEMLIGKFPLETDSPPMVSPPSPSKTGIETSD